MGFQMPAARSAHASTQLRVSRQTVQVALEHNRADSFFWSIRPSMNLGAIRKCLISQCQEIQHASKGQEYSTMEVRSRFPQSGVPSQSFPGYDHEKHAR